MKGAALANNARIVWWAEDAYRGFGGWHPSGLVPSGTLSSDGLVSPSGLSDPSGTTSLGNTTAGRFSGAQISGVYSGAGQSFDGIIYEIATYNRSLFALEIDRFVLYASGKYNLT